MRQRGRLADGQDFLRYDDDAPAVAEEQMLALELLGLEAGAVPMTDDFPLGASRSGEGDRSVWSRMRPKTGDDETEMMDTISKVSASR
jgi:hypothetical protein